MSIIILKVLALVFVVTFMIVYSKAIYNMGREDQRLDFEDLLDELYYEQLNKAHEKRG